MSSLGPLALRELEWVKQIHSLRLEVNPPLSLDVSLPGAFAE